MKRIRETGIFRSSINSSQIILETSTNQFCTFKSVVVNLSDSQIFGDEHNKRGILEDIGVEISDETDIADIDQILIDIAKDEFAEVIPLHE